MKYFLFKQSKSEKESNMSRVIGKMEAKDNQNVIVKSKYFHNCASKKSKRFRIAFTTEQINYLEREFSKFPYIGSGTRKEVSDKLQIPERAVKIWFQNRRMREKKESGNRDFEMEDITRDTTNIANEPLINSACNWQSNNDNRCNVMTMKSLAPKVPNHATLNEKLRTMTKSPCTPKVIGTANNFSNSPYVATNNALNTTPVAFRNQKKEQNRIGPIFRPNNVGVIPSKKQSKSPANHCILPKNNSSIDQDVPQDLSSKNINKLQTQQSHNYPVNSVPGPRLIPMHIQNSYPSPAFPAGHVIWRPVNMMSTLPVAQPPQVSMNIPQNSPGVHLVNNHVKGSCSCNCNCHGPNPQSYNQLNVRAHPQYILAIPFSEPPK